MDKFENYIIQRINFYNNVLAKGSLTKDIDWAYRNMLDEFLDVLTKYRKVK